MGHRQQRLALGLLLAAAPLAGHAASVTLPYRDANRWVAPADNAPLKTLMQQARGGRAFFTVALPAANRALAVERLGIVRDILAREAKRAVVMEEVSGSAKPQTLVIGY